VPKKRAELTESNYKKPKHLHQYGLGNQKLLNLIQNPGDFAQLDLGLGVNAGVRFEPGQHQILKEEIFQGGLYWKFHWPCLDFQKPYILVGQRSQYVSAKKTEIMVMHSKNREGEEGEKPLLIIHTDFSECRTIGNRLDALCC